MKCTNIIHCTKIHTQLKFGALQINRMNKNPPSKNHPLIRLHILKLAGDKTQKSYDFKVGLSHHSTARPCVVDRDDLQRRMYWISSWRRPTRSGTASAVGQGTNISPSQAKWHSLANESATVHEATRHRAPSKAVHFSSWATSSFKRSVLHGVYWLVVRRENYYKFWVGKNLEGSDYDLPQGSVLCPACICSVSGVYL